MRPWSLGPRPWTLLLAALLVAACGGSGGGAGQAGGTGTGSSSAGTSPGANGAPSVVEGTAAAGHPIVGYVYVRDRQGAEINVPIENGRYQADVSGMQPPFLIRAVPNDTSQPTQYSYAAAPGEHANVTPLTTLALFIAAGHESLKTLADTWANRYGVITADGLAAAKSTVAGNLATAMSLSGADPATFDLFATPFSPDGQGFDALLDRLSVSIDYGSGTYSVALDGQPFAFAEVSYWQLRLTGTIRVGTLTTPVDTTLRIPVDPATAGSLLDEARSQFLSSFSASKGSVTVTPLLDTPTRKTFRVQGTDPETGGIYDLTYDFRILYAGPNSPS